MYPTAFLSYSVSVSKLNVLLLTFTVILCIRHYESLLFTELLRKFSKLFVSDRARAKDSLSGSRAPAFSHLALQFLLMWFPEMEKFTAIEATTGNGEMFSLLLDSVPNFHATFLLKPLSRMWLWMVWLGVWRVVSLSNKSRYPRAEAQKSKAVLRGRKGGF